MLELYFSPGTVSHATHIALEDAGAEYSLHRLNFEKEDQRGAEYMAINPKGRVPALATPRGVLTETPAMLAYVAQSYPAAKLAPLDDPFAFGQIQAFNTYICSTLHVAHAHRMRGHRWVDDEAAIAAMQRKILKQLVLVSHTSRRTHSPVNMQWARPIPSPIRIYSLLRSGWRWTVSTLHSFRKS